MHKKTLYLNPMNRYVPITDVGIFYIFILDSPQTVGSAFIFNCKLTVHYLPWLSEGRVWNVCAFLLFGRLWSFVKGVQYGSASQWSSLLTSDCDRGELLRISWTFLLVSEAISGTQPLLVKPSLTGSNVGYESTWINCAVMWECNQTVYKWECDFF